MFSLPKILVTGALGQLGYELVAHAQEDGFDVVALPREALDIGDPVQLSEALDQYHPAYVVNAAAAIPIVEAPGDDLRVNAEGVANLAIACREREIALIHLSCAEIFDGPAEGGYREDDPVAPISAYARSKCEGEAAVRRHLDRHIILRTGWLFSARGKSFLRRLVEDARVLDEIIVSDGLTGSPTPAPDLGRVITAMIKQLDCGADVWGTYHYTASEPISWFGFAEAIIAAARQYEDLKLQRLESAPNAALPRRPRPANSTLDCSKILDTFGIHQRSWRVGLMQMIQMLYSMSAD